MSSILQCCFLLASGICRGDSATQTSNIPPTRQPVVQVLRKSDVQDSAAGQVSKESVPNEDKAQSSAGSASGSGEAPSTTQRKKSETPIKRYGNLQQVYADSGASVNLDPASQLSLTSDTAKGLGIPGLLADADEENRGKGFFEGDMMLTPDQQKILDKLKDGIISAKRALIKNTTYLWPNAVVHYTFDDDIDEIGKNNVYRAMKHWEKRTCVKFKERNLEEDYIKFVFEGGCASRVGRGRGMQKLSIGSTKLHCKKGNLIHELGHSLGFFHEHSRPDRDEYVTVMTKNIVPGFERNFLKFSTKWIDSRNIPYDYGSIMHYARAFFSRSPPLLPTLVTHRHVRIGQRIALSKSDVLQANILYNCDGTKNLDDQNEMLESDDEFYNAAPCMDTYDMRSCIRIKNMGLCSKYPRTIKDMCGMTCNLCSAKAFTMRKSNTATKKTKTEKLSHSKNHKDR